MLIDLMCPDYQEAKQNRRMVKLRLNVEGYVFIENLVREWDIKKPLPNVVHKEGKMYVSYTEGTSLYGHVPSVSKAESRELYGFHEV